jgi:type II secretory pathway pseudopilin PulG
LTVVILVLLSLISILFIGARAWKKGSDRAANILNIRNVQQAVRGHMNMNSIDTPATAGTGATLASTLIVAADGSAYMKAPVGPATVTYTYLGKAPAVGELYLIASADGLEGATYGPTTGSTSEW